MIHREKEKLQYLKWLSWLMILPFEIIILFVCLPVQMALARELSYSMLV